MRKGRLYPAALLGLALFLGSNPVAEARPFSRSVFSAPQRQSSRRQLTRTKEVSSS